MTYIFMVNLRQLKINKSTNKNFIKIVSGEIAQQLRLLSALRRSLSNHMVTYTQLYLLFYRIHCSPTSAVTKQLAGTDTDEGKYPWT